MILRLVAGVLVCFLCWPRSLSAEEWEKLTSYSPDKKFAMRVVCDNKPDDPDNIDANSITAVDIVALPQKTVVGSLFSEGSSGFKLIWASDSKWCALYSMSSPRLGETSVYHLEAGKFVHFEAEELNVPVKGDTRNQYTEPVRWLKPGTLVLKQYTIFRGEGGDSTIEFTVRFDESGKFHIVGKRNKR
jgi:hypothetical protein